LVDVLKIVPENIHESVEITHCHGFNQEVGVMREKEETTTLTHTFTSFKHTFDVLFECWVQTFNDII